MSPRPTSTQTQQLSSFPFSSSLWVQAQLIPRLCPFFTFISFVGSRLSRLSQTLVFLSLSTRLFSPPHGLSFHILSVSCSNYKSNGSEVTFFCTRTCVQCLYKNLLKRPKHVIHVLVLCHVVWHRSSAWNCRKRKLSKNDWFGIY